MSSCEKSTSAHPRVIKQHKREINTPNPMLTVRQEIGARDLSLSYNNFSQTVQQHEYEKRVLRVHGNRRGQQLLNRHKINVIRRQTEKVEGTSPEKVKGNAPYLPGEQSRKYWQLPPEERAAINIEVDRLFRAQTGVTRSLDWNDPKDRPYVRLWLHLRDGVVEGSIAKTSVGKPVETTPPRSEQEEVDFRASGPTSTTEIAPSPPPAEKPKMSALGESVKEEVQMLAKAGEVKQIHKVINEAISQGLPGDEINPIFRSIEKDLIRISNADLESAIKAEDPGAMLWSLDEIIGIGVDQTVIDQQLERIVKAVSVISEKRVDEAIKSGNPKKMLQGLETAILFGAPNKKVEKMQARITQAMTKLSQEKLATAIQTGDIHKMLESIQTAILFGIDDKKVGQMWGEIYEEIGKKSRREMVEAINKGDTTEIFKIAERIHVGLVQDKDADVIRRLAEIGLQHLGKPEGAEGFKLPEDTGKPLPEEAYGITDLDIPTGVLIYVPDPEKQPTSFRLYGPLMGYEKPGTLRGIIVEVWRDYQGKYYHYNEVKIYLESGEVQVRVPEGEKTPAQPSQVTSTGVSRSIQKLSDQHESDDGYDLDDKTVLHIDHERSHGQVLDDNPLQQAKLVLGTDFSSVRVHTSSESDALNQQLNAKAFTTGQDIFFREGEYQPNTSQGQQLIAHELTHVVQQASGAVGGGGSKMTVNSPGDRYEQEADAVAKEVVSATSSPQVQGLIPEEEERQAKALQRQAAPEEEEEETLQRQELDEEEEVINA